MRAAIIAMIPFAFLACASHSGAGPADGGPADTMTSDGAGGADANQGITCNGEQPCYSSDCTRIIGCSDIGACQVGWNQCFGPDASRDGAADQ